ncbi:MAG TPA: rubrerythrin, partial [Lachnoclostridium sp.]|nr:rubrerythrin [Lachnoclostridium sp.]
ILYAMQSRVHINMMIEIITDEIRHGILYNYLYAKNGCRG